MLKWDHHTVFGEKVNNQIERNQDLDKVSSLNGTFNFLDYTQTYFFKYLVRTRYVRMTIYRLMD